MRVIHRSGFPLKVQYATLNVQFSSNTRWFILHLKVAYRALNMENL